MKRAAAVVVAAVAVAAPVDAGGAVRITSTITPRTTAIGDNLNATILVDGVPEGAEESIDIQAPFAAFTLLDAERDATQGRVAFRFRVTCLADACAPGVATRRLRLPPFVVTAPRSGRLRLREVARWPVVSIRPRVTAASIRAAVPPLRAQDSIPRATFHVAPTALATVLAIASVALGAGALIALVTGRRQRRAGTAVPEPLSRALAAVRSAATRSAADRRRALDLLARLAPSGELRTRASFLAWARPIPTASAMRSLADDVDALSSERARA